MKLNAIALRLTSWPSRLRGMFNLNDPRWGRSDDAAAGANKPEATKPEGETPTPPPPQNDPGRGKGQGPNQGPPDLDELWRDFNRKLGGLFGGVLVRAIDFNVVA